MKKQTPSKPTEPTEQTVAQWLSDANKLVKATREKKCQKRKS